MSETLEQRQIILSMIINVHAIKTSEKLVKLHTPDRYQRGRPG